MGMELKRLADKNLDTAIELAAHYRALNEPEQAESICRDVLAVAPENVDALRTLGLALTDRFPASWMTLFDEACATFRKLPSEYERTYYVGIAWERYAVAQAAGGRCRGALNAFEDAMEHFERAQSLAAKDDPLPILHYNRCVRAVTTSIEMQREALTADEPKYELGD
jgi:tetratricopeptide (TPR) repeat protein